MAFTLAVSVALPVIAVLAARKLLNISNKPMLALLLIVLLAVSSTTVYPNMVESFTPSCGMGVSCTPFEYHAESGFCTLGSEDISDPVECGLLKNRVDTQPDHISKLCPPGNIVDIY
ncbi:MAG TPA: hypothetical protein ENH13_05855 [Euryarchaeota archaeon]|nr:hypothetical protein [Euryarchaeota archaeon]